MRTHRYILYSLLAVLAALLTARFFLPGMEAAVPAQAPAYGYNTLSGAPSAEGTTAGSAHLADITGFFLSRTPTRTHALTGACAGQNLVVLYAGGWSPDPSDRGASPALYALATDSARLTSVYRPEWYQGAEGHEFALLTGLVPTALSDRAALVYAGDRDILLPFAPARLLGAAGYRTASFLPVGTAAAPYEALGFGSVLTCSGTARDMLAATMDTYMDGAPFFVYYRLPDGSADDALSLLLDRLAAEKLSDSTVVCLLTGSTQRYRAQLFLWGGPLASAASDRPCSELDVTPTLLDLFGLPYDSRFLLGRDIFAENDEPGVPSAVTPLVPLYGSAYADWVTDMGSFSASDSVFWPAGDSFAGADADAVTAYVWGVNSIVYDGYIYSRRVLETDYFRAVSAGWTP